MKDRTGANRSLRLAVRALELASRLAKAVSATGTFGTDKPARPTHLHEGVVALFFRSVEPVEVRRWVLVFVNGMMQAVMRKKR